MHVFLAVLDAALTQAGRGKLPVSATLGGARDVLVPSPLSIVIVLHLFGHTLCSCSKI